MYENSTTLQFRPGQSYAALIVLRECVAPAIMAQTGLLGLCLLPNFGHDQVTVISTWTSQSRAQAIEAHVAYRREIIKLDRFLGNSPTEPARAHLPRN